MQRVADPAEQLSFPEHWRNQCDIGLMRRADPWVIGEKDITILNARIVRAIFHCPFDRRASGRGQILEKRTEEDEVTIFIHQRGIEVMTIGATRRAGNAHDGVAVLDVDVPHRMAHDFIRHRINLLRCTCMPFQLGINLEVSYWECKDRCGRPTE